MVKKRLLILCALMLIIQFALAQVIPYPVDSKEYSDYKQGLSGKGWIPASAGTTEEKAGMTEEKAGRTDKKAGMQDRIIGSKNGSMVPLAFNQQTRNGLLVPLDGTFVQAMVGNDDSYTTAIAIPFTFDFYGSTQTEFYINNNGNISFGNPYSTYSSTGFPIAEYPMLAAFWADVDTRPAESGQVYYKVEPNRITVIWNGVGYFSSHTDLLNTFEVIFTDGSDPLIGIGNNVAFSYGDMQWTTGDASGGTNGFGGTPGTVGLNKGDGIYYSLLARFDHEGTDYNGPSGAPSGISFLDNQLFTFNTLQGNNIPPIFLGIPSGDVVLNVGQNTSFSVNILSPISINTVTAVVQHNFSDGFSYTNSPGNPCILNLTITGTNTNPGTHIITIIASDNGDPSLNSTATITVRVLSVSEYVLVANDLSQDISVIDNSTDTVYGPFLTGLLGVEGSLLDIVVSPNSQFALVSNFENQTVYHLDISSILAPTVITSYNLGFAAEDITLSYDGRFAIVADGGTTTMLAVIDLISRATIQTINISPRFAQGVALSIDGRVLINDYDNNSVYQYQLNLQTGLLTDTGISTPITAPFNTAFHPSGQYAIACSGASGSTQVLKLNSDSSISTIQTLDIPPCQSAIYSADGTKALLGITGTSPSKMMVYNVQADGSLVFVSSHDLSYSTTGGYYGVDPIAINSGNTKVYVGNLYNINSLISVFNLQTGTSSTINTGSPAGLAMANLPLKALFSYQVPNPAYSTSVQFKQFSIGAPVSYLWNFGDGSTSTQQNPAHAYSISGVYSVSLTVTRGTATHTSSQIINMAFDADVHLSAAGSPYFFASDIAIGSAQTLTVDSGVIVQFAPNTGILINGSINADGATFTGSETEGWSGITINSTVSPQVFANCFIYNAIHALTLENTGFAIDNLYISKTEPFTDEIAVLVNGASSPIFSNLQIFGYARGLVFDNQELRTTSNPLITNVRIRNTNSSLRTESTGLEVTGAVGLEINNTQIEEYDTGILWDAQGTANYRTTPLITNVRIRNTNSSLRNVTTGIKLLNLNSVRVENDSIGGYPEGFIMDNSAMPIRTGASAVISNVRIRNTNSSLRTESTGLKLIGGILATMDSLEVEDYNTGLHYEGNGIPFERTTPLITNIRIRNTNSSLRNNPVGILLKNLAAVNLQKNLIFPAITDPLAGNAQGKGIVADGVANAAITQNTIWGYDNGLSLNNAQANFSQNIIWTKGSSLTDPILLSNATATVSNCDISYAGGSYPGQGNLNTDPKFVNPLIGNFYLKPRTPLKNILIGALPYDFEKIAAWFSHDFHPGWNLTAMPYLTRATENTPVAVFGDDLPPFYIAPNYTSILQLNQNTMPDSLGHIVFSPAVAYNVPSVVRAGVGYWVRNPNTYTTPVDVYGFMDDGSYNLQLPGALGVNNGWFLLANPYDKPIKLSDNSINFGSSMIGAWARIFHYNTNSYDPIVDLAAGDEIPAWAGFFVKANNAADMVYFNYPEDRSSGGESPLIANSGLSTSQPAKPEWQLSLKASTADFADVVTIGVSNSASDTYDGMDVPELPDAPFVLNTKLDLNIPNNDWENFPGAYTRDIKNKESGSWAWNLLLDVENLMVDNRLSETITFTPDLTAKLPAGYIYRLTDIASGNSCDLRTSGLQLVVDFDATNPESGMNPWLIPLRLEVCPVNGMGVAETRDIVSTGNYPNPFNPSTTISYNLGKDARVSVEIFNLKGQLVKRLVNDTQAKGTHNAVWNGRDNNNREVASGFYFYKLCAGESTITRKILMMK